MSLSFSFWVCRLTGLGSTLWVGSRLAPPVSRSLRTSGYLIFSWRKAGLQDCCQERVGLLLTSHLLTSLWPQQVPWPSPTVQVWGSCVMGSTHSPTPGQRGLKPALSQACSLRHTEHGMYWEEQKAAGYPVRPCRGYKIK